MTEPAEGGGASFWFYHLTRRRLEDVLPPLLERVRAKGWRAVVRCGSEARVEDLNRWLWTFRDDSFLPHGTIADGAPERQPVFLTADDARPNDAEMLFLADRAQAAPHALDAYRRVALLFDGADPDALDGARRFWKAATDAGRPAVYWADEPEGWRKKAEKPGAPA